MDTRSLTVTSLIGGRQIYSLNTTTDTAILLYENSIGKVTMLLQRRVMLRPPPLDVMEFEWDDITSPKSPSLPKKFRDSTSNVLDEIAANNITLSTPFASSFLNGTDPDLTVDLVFYSPFSTAPVNSGAPVSDGMLIHPEWVDSSGWVSVDKCIYCHPRFPGRC